jgi:hypothetical protein
MNLWSDDNVHSCVGEAAGLSFPHVKQTDSSASDVERLEATASREHVNLCGGGCCDDVGHEALDMAFVHVAALLVGALALEHLDFLSLLQHAWVGLQFWPLDRCFSRSHRCWYVCFFLAFNTCAADAQGLGYAQLLRGRAVLTPRNH